MQQGGSRCRILALEWLSARVRRLMPTSTMRFTACAIVLTASLSLAAQADSSLTRDFSRLSARERARIAQEEQAAAVKDERFQSVMAEAESLFQLQRYDQALERFREARAMRPYNVHPKVKIQDLEALIAKKALEEATEQVAEEPAHAPRASSGPVGDSVPAPVRPDPLPDARDAQAVEPVQLESSPAPVPHVVRAPPVRSVARVKVPPVAKEPEPLHVPDGVEERTFLEGRAVVLERRVRRNGSEAVYRKVTHPWGQVVHFRDGLAISEREWTEALQPR